ncbi:hypothetical protein G5714_021116 [Onychostoma macrolepis]|uniref:Uncharacterized protein n=1 Tax=Onychostoma macrolepis TaxID=369639 RepID=A0A7J6BQ04_9TELE|nr:hypothetical protein G5714_021116 [Onychostoma macrolepis]
MIKPGLQPQRASQDHRCPCLQPHHPVKAKRRCFNHKEAGGPGARAEPPDQLDQQMTADEEDKELQEEVESPGPLFTPHLPATTGGAGTLPEHHCRYRHRVAPQTPTNWPAEGHHTCLPAKHELLWSNSAQCDHTRQTICSGSPPTLKHNILYQQSETVKAEYKTYKKPATASSESTADNRTGHKGGRPQLQNLPSSQKSASHCESPFKRHGLPPHNDHLTSAELSPYGLPTTQRCLHKDC